ncbi:MAG TPA: AAA family ATPase [Gaiellaceae bacterium]|nr:AAA family ATPase [Gaiellaceae bacterium]
MRVRAIAPHGETVLVGIDGRGGSGKSTLASDLARMLQCALVVEFDDFYRTSHERSQPGDEVGGDFDWRRLRAQLLEPLTTGTAGRYRRYDWERDTLAEWHEVPAGGVVIVEGNYVTRPELRGYFDLKIWVEAAYEVRLRRGLERDGEEARARWVEEWMPEEDRYVAAFHPAEHVDVIVSGEA